MRPVYEPEAYAKRLGEDDFLIHLKTEIAERGFVPQQRLDDIGTYYPPAVGLPMKVYIVYEGSMSVWINKDYYSLKPGSRLIVPTGVLHWARVGANGCRYYLGMMQKKETDDTQDETSKT
jgi:hypothetical protein